MEKVIHRESERGKGDHGWLKTRHSFSFANWYEPTRMGFGALRVINDDWIAPRSGFGTHQHQNMEIVTVVTEGTLTHKDSMGNVGVIGAGEVQTMSAGTGVAHSEFNESESPLSLFQIWIVPKKENTQPRYGQRLFPAVENAITLLVGPEGTPDALVINQDAYISRARLDSNHPLTYIPHRTGNGVYVFVIEGSLAIAGELLYKRDAVGIVEPGTLELATDSGADVLIFEVSMA